MKRRPKRKNLATMHSRRMDGQVKELWGKFVILYTKSSRDESIFACLGQTQLLSILPRNKSFMNCWDIEIANIGGVTTLLSSTISLKSFYDENRRKRGFTMFVFFSILLRNFYDRNYIRFVNYNFTLYFTKLYMYIYIS